MRDILDYISSMHLIEPTVRKEMKQKQFILHGAKALNKQTKFPFQRATTDYDFFVNNPKKESESLKNKLNKVRKNNYHFVKEGSHKTTFKVKDIGFDLKKNTSDDLTIADFTKKPKNLKVKQINGLLVRDIKDILKSKKKILTKQKYSYRHKKDMEDIARLRARL